MKIHRYMYAYLSEGSCIWTPGLCRCWAVTQLLSFAARQWEDRISIEVVMTKPLAMESTSRCRNVAPGHGTSIWLPWKFLIPDTEMVNPVLDAEQQCGKYWNCTVTNRTVFKKRCVLGCYLVPKPYTCGAY